jgi:hypothetical protein
VVGPNGSATDFSLSLDGPPPPPTLIATRQSNGSYQIQVTGVAGQSFIIQASSDSVNWVAIRTDTLIGTNLNFIETTAAGSRQLIGFFRSILRSTISLSFSSRQVLNPPPVSLCIWPGCPASPSGSKSRPISWIGAI